MYICYSDQQPLPLDQQQIPAADWLQINYIIQRLQLSSKENKSKERSCPF